MTRVISLLLLVPFLTVQAWALQGGPFDGFNGRSMSAFSGTYGVVLNGNSNPADTGIMTMAIPTSGMVQSRVLIFSKGLMYIGSSMGTMDQRTGSITMMSQMSHFASRVVTDGIQKQSGVFVDSMLTGKMGMGLVLNYFSGMLELKGDATYYAYDPMLSSVSLTVTTENGNANKVQNQNTNSTLTTSVTANRNASSSLTSNAGQNSSTDNSTNVSQSSTTSTTGSVVNADGSVTTSSDNSSVNKTANTNDGTNALSLTQTNQASSDDSSNADNQTKGATLVAGTSQTTTQTKTTTTYDPNAVRQQPVGSTDVPMTFKLDGVRQDTSVALLSPFTPPSEETFFQIEVAAPAGGGAGGGGNGGGATGATGVRTN